MLSKTAEANGSEAKVHDTEMFFLILIQPLFALEDQGKED